MLVITELKVASPIGVFFPASSILPSPLKKIPVEACRRLSSPVVDLLAFYIQSSCHRASVFASSTIPERPSAMRPLLSADLASRAVVSRPPMPAPRSSSRARSSGYGTALLALRRCISGELYRRCYLFMLDNDADDFDRAPVMKVR